MILRLTFGMLCAIAFAGCQKAATPHASPAKVEKAPSELQIARVTLDPKAKERLGITTVPAKREKVERRRTLPGELMAPAGKTTVVTAQISGMIQAPQAEGIPTPGASLNVGDPVLLIAPLLTPDRFTATPAERVQMANAEATLAAALTVAQGDVERGSADVEGFKIALDRAERLFADKAGAERAVDDAKQQLAVATATYDAARACYALFRPVLSPLPRVSRGPECRERPCGRAGEARSLENPAELQLKSITGSKRRAAELEQLMQGLSGQESGAGPQVEALTIQSPQTGVLRSLSVSEGQAVNAGSPLFDVVDVRTMWVRVPVYVGMLDEIRTDADARIVGLDGEEAGFTRAARPAAAPPSADALSTTADVFFEVDNSDGALKPGQRVGAELLVEGEEESLVVPAASILYDIYGGAWVYEAVDEYAYERRRVSVRYVKGDSAILAEGPSPDTPIVVDGAAELFGTEFGAGK